MIVWFGLCFVCLFVLFFFCSRCRTAAAVRARCRVRRRWARRPATCAMRPPPPPAPTTPPPTGPSARPVLLFLLVAFDCFFLLFALFFWFTTITIRVRSMKDGRNRPG